MKSESSPPGSEPQDREETRSRFLSTISHELRTPLVAILGYADVLLEELSEGSGTHTAAERIRHQGEHLLRQLDDLLDLVQLEEGDVELRPEEGSLAEVIRGACSGIAPLARGKGLELAIEVRRDVPRSSRFDLSRAAQVIRHLVDNAVKFTPRGSVTVRACVQPGPVAEISVTDTGVGLSPSRFEELSAPLVQGDDTLSRCQPGCGIGLALARGIARSLGGTLSCQGGIGAGTTIRFRFPLEGAGPPADHGSFAGPVRGRVLLVEDSPDNQVLLRRTLERIGLEVEVAEDGIEGVAAALHRSFDLVLMDIQMPRMDGLAATRELRLHGFEVPIVALTANREENCRQQCEEAGFDDYLTKPVDRMKLLERVVRILKEGRLRLQNRV